MTDPVAEADDFPYEEFWQKVNLASQPSRGDLLQDLLGWTDEECLVDEIRATLHETGLPGWNGPNFDEMARCVVHDDIPFADIDQVKEAIEYGFDQTNDVDGPNFEYMAQLIFDKFCKERDILIDTDPESE